MVLEADTLIGNTLAIFDTKNHGSIIKKVQKKEFKR